MAERLVPAAAVEDCVEVHLARHAPTGQALYLATLLLTIGSAAALPMVQVPITVQASGVIRPIVERREARAADNGVVRTVHVRDGQRVRAGDTLLVLDGSAIAARFAVTDSIMRLREQELTDLTTLLDTKDSLVPREGLGNVYRRQQLQQHALTLTGLVSRVSAEAREAGRLHALLDRGFVAPEQVERQDEAERAARAALREQVERMRSSWSDDHSRIADELRSLHAESAELSAALARQAVIAPVDGTAEMSISVSTGSVLERGERVAMISPNTQLIGEALLTAHDIVLVHPGTPVRLMIDGLNYRDWGTLEATVIEVADDASLAGDQPVFRVRCRLDRGELHLRSGRRASLGKGMTFRARFVIAERSLLQLLLDRVDDWLDPARAPSRTPVTR